MDDDDVTAPQILLESFSLCNNCVVGGAVGTPDHFERHSRLQILNLNLG